MFKYGDKVRTTKPSTLHINGNPEPIIIPAGFKGVVYFESVGDSSVLVDWDDTEYAGYMPALFPVKHLELIPVLTLDQKNENASLWDELNEE